MDIIQMLFRNIDGVVSSMWYYTRDVTLLSLFPWDTFSLSGVFIFCSLTLLGARFGLTHEYMKSRALVCTDKSWSSAFRALLPPKNWNYSALKQDLLLTFTILFMFGIYLFYVIPLAADGVSRRLIFPYAAKIFGFEASSLIPMSHGPLIDLSYSLFLLVMNEFGYWVYHYIAHKVPFIWEYHKVHHAQASMTPATDYRHHPVDFTLFYFSQGLFVGIGAVIFYLLFGANSVGQDSQFVAYCFLVIVYMPGSLQHSYRWWSWGKLEKVFLSPAWHILHHSKDPKHFNTNFGNRLTIFDHLFKTVSKTSATPPEGGIELGIPDDGYNWADASLWRLLIDPVKRSFKIIFHK